jgi:hypothetical protein
MRSLICAPLVVASTRRTGQSARTMSGVRLIIVGAFAAAPACAGCSGSSSDDVEGPIGNAVFDHYSVVFVPDGCADVLDEADQPVLVTKLWCDTTVGQLFGTPLVRVLGLDSAGGIHLQSPASRDEVTIEGGSGFMSEAANLLVVYATDINGGTVRVSIGGREQCAFRMIQATSAEVTCEGEPIEEALRPGP